MPLTPVIRPPAKLPFDWTLMALLFTAPGVLHDLSAQAHWQQGEVKLASLQVALQHCSRQSSRVHMVQQLAEEAMLASLVCPPFYAHRHKVYLVKVGQRDYILTDLLGCTAAQQLHKYHPTSLQQTKSRAAGSLIPTGHFQLVNKANSRPRADMQAGKTLIVLMQSPDTTAKTELGVFGAGGWRGGGGPDPGALPSLPAGIYLPLFLMPASLLSSGSRNSL